MRKVSILIGICMLTALALTLVAQQQDLSPVMKEVGSTSGSFRTALQAGSAADIARDAAKLEGLFRQAQTWFKGQKADKAAEWAEDVAKAAAATAKAAKANDLDAAKAAAGTVNKACKSCHEVHREQLPDKTYRFKP